MAFVPILMLVVVGLIVLLIAMRAWWKDSIANQEDENWGPKSQQARGSSRGASSMPQSQQGIATMSHMSKLSQPPSVMGLHAPPGKPRDVLLPGTMPQKSSTQQKSATLLLQQSAHKSVTPLQQSAQKSATPLRQQSDLPSERNSVTPTYGKVESTLLSVNQLARGTHLCLDLVVPEENECSLLLPKIVEGRFSESSVLSITGDNGLPVLFASYTLAAQPPLGSEDLPGNGKRLVLRSALEDVILATCEDADPGIAGGAPQLLLLNKAEELFGMLGATGPGSGTDYLLSRSTGEKISIRKDIKALSSCITDEEGWLLACSEDTGEHGRPICISPGVDAGLMTLTMLGTDILDLLHQQHSRTASRMGAACR